tara:strand:- start:9818 stop:12256 length:2439 start_codon:yes stop_codon:yes gene_type:complete
MKKLFTVILLFSIALSINLNSLNDSDINELSKYISKDKSLLIKSYITNNGHINNIYELNVIDGIDILDIQIIKPYVSVSASINESLLDKRSLYKLEWWLADSDNQGGVSENSINQYFNPMNINEMNYDDLISLPNLSPIDVKAVLLQKKRGSINGTFQLKNSPGISRYGYKNLVDFVSFDDKKNSNNFFRFTTLIKNSPLTSTPDDDAALIEFYDPTSPQILSKYLLSNKNSSVGYIYNKNTGEAFEYANQKFYLSFNNIPINNEIKLLRSLRIDHLIFGNFNASFGQGIVFENSDSFSPRRTGFGFSKRLNGINPDQSNSSQYTLNGLAIQLSNDFMRFSSFISNDKRDAIINEDESFSSLILMQPRMPMGLSQDTSKIFSPLTDSVNELTIGGNFRLSPLVGTNLGFTIYQSLYDKVLDPQIRETILGGEDPDYSGDTYYLTYMTNSADPEINAMYQSSSTSNLWSNSKSSRGAIGFDFTSVIKNIAIQGEFGTLMKNWNYKSFKKSPKAKVLSSFIQFNNFNLLALYRNYDLEYDNPYQRSFSNYQRFKTSIFEDSYWLEDPAYAFLYTANPQPQSEEGIYLTSRYQFHRNLTGTLASDHWSRKADDAKYYRTVAQIQWRPVFKYRIYFRQKWQARGSHNIFHPSPYYSRETRIRVKMLLSNYNELEFLYSLGYTTFSPRPRLTDGPSGEDMVVGDIGSPDKTIGITLKYNVNERFKIRTGSLYVKGFTWYFADNDFRIFDSNFGAFHHWISLYGLVNNAMSFNFKLSFTSDYPTTNITEAQTDQGSWIRNPWVSKNQFDYKIQVDYAF